MSSDENGNAVLSMPAWARGSDDTLLALYCVVSNAYDQVYVWQPGSLEPRAWVSGVAVEPEDRLRLQPGLYPLFLIVRVPPHFPLAAKPRLGPLFWVEGTGPEDRGPMFGHSQSPLVLQDKVIVAPLMRDAGLVACDKRTGEILWRTPSLGGNPFSHASPVLARLDGVLQVICMANDVYYRAGDNRKAVISGVAVDSGELLWQVESYRFYNIPIPSVLPIDGRRLFVAGGYWVGAFMLACGREDDTWVVDYEFQDATACAPQLHRAVLYRDHLYIQSFDRYHGRTKDGVLCMDLEGRVLWESGPGDTYDSGGLLVADGRIYVMHGRTGELSMIEATPEGYRLMARAKVLDARKGQAWAPLALSRGRLLVRDQQTLRCLDVSARRTESDGKN
jgi:outer membrane protein assembly factor BamB